MHRKLIGKLLIASMMASLVFGNAPIAVTQAAEQQTADAVVTRSGVEELVAIEIPWKEAEELEAESESDGEAITLYSARDWSQYSNDYIYQQLTKAEQAFWDGLVSMCETYLTTTADASDEAKTVSGVECYLLDAVTCENLTSTEMRNVIYAMMYQNPQYYFLSQAYTYSYGTGSTTYKVFLTCFPIFRDGEERATITEQMFDKVDAWTDEIKKESTTLAKEKKAHDIVCLNVEYDNDASYNQSAYSSIMLGESVCAGYTKMYSILTNAVGIPTLGVLSSNHAWNKSCVDGTWYNVDTTWGDQNGYIYYGYFNKSDSAFVDSGHNQVAWFDGKVPEANTDSETLPSERVTPEVTSAPTAEPTATPTSVPTVAPTAVPTATPSTTARPSDAELTASYGAIYSTYEGYSFREDSIGDVRCYDAEGNMFHDNFKCDGTYTYYFESDGTSMRDRLTYHPDGIHVIYFDSEGHEVFSDFANVKKTIAGKAVDDYCFFDVQGYLYVDVVTYDKTGTKIYYANEYGVMDRGKWFKFTDTAKWANGVPFEKAGGEYGYAQADGSLMTNTYTYDWQGRYCYLQGNGVAIYN